MRRLGTPLLVAALAALGLVAALDAIQPGDQRPVVAEESAPETVPQLPQLPRDATIRLFRAHVGGTLGWSDADCGRHELTLPQLTQRDFLTRGCDVFSRRGNLGLEDGNVRWFAFSGGATTLATREDVDAALHDGHRVRDVAWLGGTRFAALVAQPGRQGHLVTIFDRDRLHRVVTQVGPTWTEVRASPHGSYFAVVHRAGGLVVYDRDGRRVGPPPSLRLARAIAWSPDERWSALATKGNVWIVGTGQTALTPLAVLALRAVDLDWRRTSN